jgi:hypothetical protein
MGANELSALLWRERASIEAAIALQGQLLAAFEANDLFQASEAVASVDAELSRLRSLILLRDIETESVAQEWDAPGTRLNQLPDHAPPGPWGEILADHLRELGSLAGQAVEQHDIIGRHPVAVGFSELGRYPLRADSYDPQTDG